MAQAVSLQSQTFDDATHILSKYDVQAHGYATQGFLYTTQNNIYTTKSSDGSLRWTDAVVNITALPRPKLRVGAQARYFLFGNYSNAVSLDWAALDYKFNDHIGLRAGKVKTPSSLFNEVQDIDPAYLWCLLPQSVYPVSSRNSLLSLVGGVVYGSFKMGEQLGKLEYRGWGGRQTIDSNDGYFTSFKELGIDLPNGVAGEEGGGTVRWKTPLSGLLVGASGTWKNTWQSKLVAGNGALTGTYKVAAFNVPNYFLSYEHGKFAGAGEYSRLAPHISFLFPEIPPSALRLDNRQWYAMATYKATTKLHTGLYFGEQVDHSPDSTPAEHYSKDWALAGRYDFNQYFYGKVEEHFVDGTGIGYDTTLNPNGLRPNTRLTLLKFGFNF